MADKADNMRQGRTPDPASQFIQDIEPYLYGKPIVYVDIGAFRGSVAKALVDSRLSVRKAHLIEPNPQAYRLLQARVEHWAKVRYISCHNIAISNVAATIQMRAEGGMTSVVQGQVVGAAATNFDSSKFEVDAVTFDEFANECTLSHISLLKIDVEGHEMQVLNGALRLLEHSAVDIIYIEAGLQSGEGQQTYYRDIEDLLISCDYRIFGIYEQVNEWLTDSPLLRRINIAFMSKEFAQSNPHQVTRELFRSKLEAERLAAEVGQLQANLTSKDEAMDKLTQNAAATVAVTDSKIKILEDQIDTLSRDLFEERKARQGMAVELLELRRTAGLQIKGLSKRLDVYREDNKRLSLIARKYGELNPYAAELEQKYMALIRSTSWRITGPLRFILSRLRARGGTAPEIEWLPDRSLSGRSGAGSAVRADQLVRSLRRRMLDLGFVEAAKERLEEWASDSGQRIRQRLAARELLGWHLNQGTLESAQEALMYLPAARKGEKGKDACRRLAIMESELYSRLGRRDEAYSSLEKQLKISPHPDVYLAFANLEDTELEKLAWVNAAFSLLGLEEIAAQAGGGDNLYDRLATLKLPAVMSSGTLVTVIVPAYNSQETIGTALRALTEQTWNNLEILVVDDCSTDRTADVVADWCRRDSRIRLIRAPLNRGAYVARNTALVEAQGELVTCHDADDWSHPRKIEVQALHLLANPLVVGNQASQARTTDGLIFNRRGNFGQYIFANLSSLMFRRIPVLERLGYWDSVRFMGDGEFLRRLEREFGSPSIVVLEDALTSFQRFSESSLTENSAFGFHGFMMGARREYFDASFYHHEVAECVKYNFPQQNRPFSIPAPLLPDRALKPVGRHYDVIIASDFRLAGGSTLSSLEEVKAQAAAGLTTGLIQMSRFDIDPTRRRMNKKLRELVNAGFADILVYGENISCDLLIVRYPPVLQYRQRYLPSVSAREVRVIINQPPMSDYGPDAVLRYEIPRCAEFVKQAFGSSGVWHPIGPAVREALHTHHSKDLSAICLSEKDWVNIIDALHWKRVARPAGNVRPKIGRHARDHEVKWPGDRDELLTVYPDSNEYEVYIMGGAEIPRKILGGQLPANWNVVPFDGLSAKEYLADLDVFVYYTHTDWVESFGRVIIEAMAVGVPVILPPSYQELFEDAAIYSEPSGVLKHIDKLMGDAAEYKRRVDHALEFVDRKFGYAMHAARLQAAIDAR